MGRPGTDKRHREQLRREKQAQQRQRREDRRKGKKADANQAQGWQSKAINIQ